MDADPLIDLLGRRADDPAVEAAFVDLRTLRRPQLDPRIRDAYLDWVLVRKQGVELGFVDEVYFQAGDRWKRRRKGVSLNVRQIYFYSKRDDIVDFTGKLPFGLKWADDRDAARRKLSGVGATGRFYL